MSEETRHSCQYCGKQYTRKTSHSRHTILCEIFHKNNTETKREKLCEEEEDTNIPSTKQLYKIIQELAIKYQNMEQKMNDMHKWVEKKKKKLNVLQWLNTNVKPNLNIQNWIKSIQATEEHIEILIEHNMVKTISAILNKKMSTAQSAEYIHPLYCLTQKANLFYCYNSEEEKWKHFSTEEFIVMLNEIHRKILNALCEWHDKNIEKIETEKKERGRNEKETLKRKRKNNSRDSIKIVK